MSWCLTAMAIWSAVRMPNPIKVLLLGGTSEARMLAARLDADERFTVETSLAGATEKPLPVAGGSRRCGFGGTAGLADYLRAASVDIVIDGTHAFAATISRNAAEACDQTKTERLVVQRPPWEKTEGDRWLDVSDVPEAAAAVSQRGGRVFITIGRQDIAAFSGCRDAWFLIRSIDRPKQMIEVENYQLLQARGPFDFAAEKALLETNSIDLIVSKNSGGPDTYAKIEAARALALPVVMIRRPTPPDGSTVPSVEAALAWLDERYAEVF